MAMAGGFGDHTDVLEVVSSGWRKPLSAGAAPPLSEPPDTTLPLGLN